MQKTPEAVFVDFDGTLVRPDTVVRFLLAIWRRRFINVLATPILWPLFLVLYFIIGAQTQALSFIMWVCTVGRSKRRLVRDLALIRQRLLASLRENEVHREVLQDIESHRMQGRVIVYISGSAKYWLRPMLDILDPGPKIVIGTQFRFYGTGLALWHRCYGQEKARMMRAYFLTEPRWAEGYSDSLADLPMLKRCEKVTLINSSRRLLEKSYRLLPTHDIRVIHSSGT